MISKEKVKRYCVDFTQIENYDVAISDNSKIWDCHNRLETHIIAEFNVIRSCGKKYQEVSFYFLE